MKTIMISPTKKASQRTKNRIRENGPVFEFHNETGSNWLLRAKGQCRKTGGGAGEWFGWLPRNEFHVEILERHPRPTFQKPKFIKKVRG